MSRNFRPVALLLALALAIGPAFSMAEESRYTSDEALESIRARIRAEAGLGQAEEAPEEPAANCATTVGTDIPMVAVTVLKGDTVERLALELTGIADSARIIRASASELKPGDKFMLPRTLLKPSLADVETTRLPLGLAAPTVRSLVVANVKAKGAEIDVAARNLMRLNNIVDPALLKSGEEIEVPRAMLAVSLHAAPPAEIRDDYRAGGFRKVVAKKSYSSKKGKRARKVRLVQTLESRGRDIDLVVIHTTEHSNSSFPSSASYIQRNHLAHYVIGPKGEIFRVVPEEYRAHGAGEAIWNGTRDVDARAINIEIFANTADSPKYSGINDAQYEGLARLIDDIRSRRPEVHAGRVVTHSMVAMSFKYKTRSRKGDPYVFDWAKAGLPNNSLAIDQDVLLGRVRLCEDKRYADRVTPGQEAAAKFINKM